MLPVEKLHISCVTPLPESSASPFDISSHEDWFRRYAEAEIALCDGAAEAMHIKERHTFGVLANARAIADEEGFSPVVSRACLLAALYHDLGRFEQYRVWRTFHDQSSCSHGELSAYLLEHFGLLACEPLLASAVVQACSLHSLQTLPADLSRDVRLITEVVRDADRIDILKINAGELAKKPLNPAFVHDLPDDAGVFSSRVIEKALAGRSVSYQELASVNDFRILLGTWFFQMTYASSRRRLAEEGFLTQILTAVPDGPHAQARDVLLAAIADELR